MADDAIAKLLRETKAGIEKENLALRRRLEANDRLLEQIHARLEMSCDEVAEISRREPEVLPPPKQDDKTKKQATGAAVAFSSDSHAAKLMRVIYKKRSGVTSEELQSESGIDPATVKDIKKTVWNTTWRLCNEGYAKRIGEQSEKVIPTDKGIKAWEASPLHRAA